MDFVESSKSQWSGRYSWGDENQSNTGLTLDGTKTITNFEQYMGSNTRTFTPNTVNEAALRLHAVLQLHRHLPGLHRRTW